MILITVFMSIFGRSTDKFSNSLLFAGDVPYNDPALNAVADRFVGALRKSAFDAIEFTGWKIAEVTSEGKKVKDKSRSNVIALRGATPLPAGSVLAPRDVVLRLGKYSGGSTPAITPLRNFISSDEYNTYVETRALPSRVVDKNDLADILNTSFPEAISNVAGNSGLTLVLPFRRSDNRGTPRAVNRVQAVDIRTSRATKTRTSAMTDMVNAAKKHLNALKRQAEYATAVDPNGVFKDSADTVWQRLRTEALAYWNGLDPVVKTRVTVPTIFDSNPLTGGV